MTNEQDQLRRQLFQRLQDDFGNDTKVDRYDMAIGVDLVSKIILFEFLKPSTTIRLTLKEALEFQKTLTKSIELLEAQKAAE